MVFYCLLIGNLLFRSYSKINYLNHQNNYEILPHHGFFQSVFYQKLGVRNARKTVKADWELINIKYNIGIRESSGFQTNKLKLWGWGHIIRPELFIDIEVVVGKSIVWVRNYKVFHVD